jgi:hypothetical protein
LESKSILLSLTFGRLPNLETLLEFDNQEPNNLERLCRASRTDEAGGANVEASHSPYLL